MKASIVILNWNGGDEDCIESVESALDQNYQDKEIIFVDNSSTDGSSAQVKKIFPDLTYVWIEENIGCPAGRNKGAEVATGDLLFFLENDGAWESNSLVADAVELFEVYEDLGAVYTRVTGYETGVTDPVVDNFPDVAATDGLYMCSSFRGGASIIRGTLFSELGGFPADFFRQWEERFLSLMIYNKKYKVAYWPKHVLRHKGSDYPNKSKIVYRYNFENKMKMVMRLYPMPKAIQISLAIYLLHVWRFISKLDILEFVAISWRLLKIMFEKAVYIRVSENTINLVESMHSEMLQMDLSQENKPLQDICCNLEPVNYYAVSTSLVRKFNRS